MKVMFFIVALMSASQSFAAGTAKAPKSTPELLAKGKQVFMINCMPCHGEKGEGNGPAAIALNPKPRNYTKDGFKNGDKVEQIFGTITKGLPGTMMTAWTQIPEADRWALAYFVKSFRPNTKK